MKTFKIARSEPLVHEAKTLYRLTVTLPCGHGVVVVQAAKLLAKAPPCPVCSGEESV